MLKCGWGGVGVGGTLDGVGGVDADCFLKFECGPISTHLVSISLNHTWLEMSYC